MGSRCDCTWVLGLTGFRVVGLERSGEGADSRMTVRIERSGARRYPCSGCGRRTRRVRSVRDRTWDDLPWASHPVTLVYAQRRVRCRQCGIRTEQVDFAEAKARVTRRLRQQIGVDCQSMPTSHAAVRHGVSWGKARRAEHAFLRDWDAQRPRRRPRYLGADEIHRGKKHKFYTVLSDLVHGEVLGLAKDRTEESLVGLLTTCLDARQRGAVEAVCTDMHRPYVNAVGHQLPQAEVVFDKFHVLQHAGAALDDVRRQEFFRAGAIMRAFNCSPPIAGCSRRMCCASNSIGCGPTRPEMAWPSSSSGGSRRCGGNGYPRWRSSATPWSTTSTASLPTATIRCGSASSSR